MTPQELTTFMSKFEMTTDTAATFFGVTPGAVIHWLKQARGIPVTTQRVIRFFSKHPELVKEF